VDLFEKVPRVYFKPFLRSPIHYNALAPMSALVYYKFYLNNEVFPPLPMDKPFCDMRPNSIKAVLKKWKTPEKKEQTTWIGD
jgi:predicted glycosyltransferase